MIKVICFDSSKTRNLLCLSNLVNLTFDIHFFFKEDRGRDKCLPNQHSAKLLPLFDILTLHVPQHISDF